MFCKKFMITSCIWVLQPRFSWAQGKSNFMLPVLRPNLTFEPRLKFQMCLKSDCLQLKLYLIFQDLSRRSIETGFWRIKDTTKIHWIWTLVSFLKRFHCNYYDLYNLWKEFHLRFNVRSTSFATCLIKMFWDSRL